MFSVHCVVCSVHFLACSVQCSLCSVQFSLCSVQCALCIVHCAVFKPLQTNSNQLGLDRYDTLTGHDINTLIVHGIEPQSDFVSTWMTGK